MREVRQLLIAYLTTLHSRVSYQVAADATEFPYLVVDIPTGTDDGEGGRLLTVDIDGWDNKPDTTELEALMETVNAGLNKRTLSNSSVAATFYLDTILSLTDDDPRLRRRKYIYQAHVFGRS